MIKVGDKLPEVTLQEYVQTASDNCPIGPNPLDIGEAAAGKTIALFAVPGAFTPACSEKHLPGYVEQASALQQAGVDEIWCVAVNDAFVMGAWGQQQGTEGKVRMIGDGSGVLAKALGLELDLTAHGLGVRSRRYSMLVKDGVVKTLNLEDGPALSVSDANTLLEQARAL